MEKQHPVKLKQKFMGSLVWCATLFCTFGRYQRALPCQWVGPARDQRWSNPLLLRGQADLGAAGCRLTEY
jgi:hypothetical protein